EIPTRRSHDQSRHGLTPSTEEDHSVDRICADGFFYIHAHQIAKEHGGRPGVRFSQRGHREFKREPAGFPDTALDAVRELAEVCVAGRQLRPGIAYPDHW